MKKNRKNRLLKKRYNVSTPNKNKSSVSYTKFRRNKCTESVKNLKQERFEKEHAAYLAAKEKERID
jgi:hypothetical protein